MSATATIIAELAIIVALATAWRFASARISRLERHYDEMYEMAKLWKRRAERMTRDVIDLQDDAAKWRSARDRRKAGRR